MKGTNMKNYRCTEKEKQNEPDFIFNIEKYYRRKEKQ
jgi:hypothetical protein